MPQAGEKANAGATVGITAYLRRKKEELPLEYILNYKKLTETAKVPTRLKEVRASSLWMMTTEPSPESA